MLKCIIAGLNWMKGPPSCLDQTGDCPIDPISCLTFIRYWEVSQQILIVYQQQKQMFGRYHDSRVYQHFVHTYSKVPYLDTEIFNVETNALRESRRANLRAQAATEGLKRTEEKSEQLSNSIRESRIKKQQEAKEFLLQLEKTQEQCLQKEKLAWSNYEKEREQSQITHLKDQRYLETILKSNSTKAESRLSSVRRWY